MKTRTGVPGRSNARGHSSRLAMTLSVAAVLGATGVSEGYTQHYNKVVSLLEVPNAACYFFQLEGVSVVGSTIANSAWFAIARNAENAKELYALVLSAKLTGTPLSRVLTSGDVACGQAEVLTIDL